MGPTVRTSRGRVHLGPSGSVHSLIQNRGEAYWDERASVAGRERIIGADDEHESLFETRDSAMSVGRKGIRARPPTVERNGGQEENMATAEWIKDMLGRQDVPESESGLPGGGRGRIDVVGL